MTHGKQKGIEGPDRSVICGQDFAIEVVMQSLEALYYPQIVLLSETLLKYLLLVFDKIAFLPNDIELAPGRDSIRDRFSINDDVLFSAFGTKQDCFLSGIYSSDVRFWDDKMKRLMETYDYLESQGICLPIKDKAFEDPRNWHPLKPIVDVDVRDTKFVQYCESALNKRLILAGNPNAEIKGGGFVMRESEHKGVEGFAALCSQRINSTLYLAGKENLIPVSSQDFFIQLLQRKLNRVSDDEDYPKEKVLRENRRRTVLGLLTYEMIAEGISTHAMDSKTIDQLLKYKTASKESQERFRNYLFRLEARLEEAPWEKDFVQKIDKLVSEEILPEIQKVREAKALIWEKLFGETIKSVFSEKALTPWVIGSILVFAPLPYLDTLMYGTAAALTTLLPKLADLAAEERQRRRHSLYYVANFR